ETVVLVSAPPSTARSHCAACRLFASPPTAESNGCMGNRAPTHSSRFASKYSTYRRLSLSDSFVLNPVLDNVHNSLHRAHIQKRIAVDYDHVRQSPRCDCAYRVLPFQKARRPEGRGADNIHGGHAKLDHRNHFSPGRVEMKVQRNAGIRSHHNS